MIEGGTITILVQHHRLLRVYESGAYAVHSPNLPTSLHVQIAKMSVGVALVHFKASRFTSIWPGREHKGSTGHP